MEEPLREIRASIVALYQDKKSKSTANPILMLGYWHGDPELQIKIQTLKSGSESISNACTRLAMVFTQAKTLENLKSVILELIADIQTFYGGYFSLVEYVEQLIILSFQKGTSVDLLLSHTGMVWECNTALQKCPSINSTAYREDMMGEIAAIKETIAEFEGYIQSTEAAMIARCAENNQETGAEVPEVDKNEEEQPEEDDNDDFFGDNEYTIDEIPVVVSTLTLFQLAKSCLETGMVIVTMLGNDVKPTTSTTTTTNDDSNMNSFMEWIASFISQYNPIQKAVTNLGAELYHPCDVDSIESNSSVLRDRLKVFLDSFSVELVVSVLSSRPNLAQKVETLHTTLKKIIDECSQSKEDCEVPLVSSSTSCDDSKQ